MSSPSPSARPHEQPLDHAAKRAVILGLLLPMFLGALDFTIVGTAMPKIAADLKDFDNISWVVTAYLLAATVATPLYGKLSDLYGRRTLMLVAIGITLAGAVVSAMAESMLVLIIGRVLQGFGGGGTIPLAQTVMAEITTPYERPRYQGYTSTMFMVSSVVGPALGGIISDYLHWSLIFWINVPFGIAAFAVTFVMLRGLPRHDRPHKLDLLGASLMMSAGLTLMLAMTWGGRRYPWLSPEIAGLLVGSVLLWAGFAWRMLRAEEPFVPLAVLRDPTMRHATGITFFSSGTFVGLNILVPLYLIAGLGLSATDAGLAVITLQVGATLSSIFGTYALVRMRRYMRVPLGSSVLAIVFLMVLVVEPIALPFWAILVLLTLIGIGLGTLFPLSIILVQNVIGASQLGIATAVTSFFRSLGGAFIIAAFGAILVVAGGPGSGVADPTAFRWVFLAAILFLVAGMVFIALVEEKPWGGAPTTAAPPVD